MVGCLVVWVEESRCPDFQRQRRGVKKEVSFRKVLHVFVGALNGAPRLALSGFLGEVVVVLNAFGKLRWLACLLSMPYLLCLQRFSVSVNNEVCNLIDHGVNSQMNEGV
ncbi:hypothetical protein D3C77_612770 [compost metagenome]